MLPIQIILEKNITVTAIESKDGAELEETLEVYFTM